MNYISSNGIPTWETKENRTALCAAKAADDGLEIEIAVPVLKPGRPNWDDNIPQPLDLISIAEQRHNIVHPALGSIRFDEFSYENWGKRISSTIFVPTTIYMADALENRPRSEPAFKDQIGPRIPVGSEPLAFADWANPDTHGGRFLLYHGTYVVNARHVKEGWKIDSDSSVEPTYYRGPHANPEFRDLFPGQKYDMRSKYAYVPLEANSPILWATTAGFKECERAIKAITGSSRAEVNSSTGMHVHVGNGDAGFDLPTLKLLIVALLVWEPMIGTLHPLWRRGWGIVGSPGTSANAGYSGAGARFCMPLRNAIHFERPQSTSRFWRQVPDWWYDKDPGISTNSHYWNMRDPIAKRLPSCVNGHPEIPAWAHAAHMRCEYTERLPKYNYSCILNMLRELQSVDTIDELHKSLTDRAFGDDIGKYTAYNLFNLTSDAIGDVNSGGKRTIEFRQHAGCLDPSRAHMWMRFCTAVTAWAKMIVSQGEEVHDGVRAQLFDQLRRKCDHAVDDASPPPQDLRSIFRVIGISDEEIKSNGWEGYVNGDGWDRWEYKFYTALRDDDFTNIWFTSDDIQTHITKRHEDHSFSQIFYTEEVAKNRDLFEQALKTRASEYGKKDGESGSKGDSSNKESSSTKVKSNSVDDGKDDEEDSEVASEEVSIEIEYDSEDDEESDEDDDDGEHDSEDDCRVIKLS